MQHGSSKAVALEFKDLGRVLSVIFSERDIGVQHATYGVWKVHVEGWGKGGGVEAIGKEAKARGTSGGEGGGGVGRRQEERSVGV